MAEENVKSTEGIISDLEALAMLGFNSIEPEALADVKKEALVFLNNQLTWAKTKLAYRQSELPKLTLFHGKVKDQFAIAALEVDIFIAEALIKSLSNGSITA